MVHPAVRPFIQGVTDEVGLIAQRKFLHQTGMMDFNGARANKQTSIDLGTCISLGGQLPHFPLSRRQRRLTVSYCSRGVFDEGVDRYLGKERRDIMKAGSDVAYGAHELLGGRKF
jgi:hypothetical protein